MPNSTKVTGSQIFHGLKISPLLHSDNRLRVYNYDIVPTIFLWTAYEIFKKQGKTWMLLISSMFVVVPMGAGVSLFS